MILIAVASNALAQAAAVDQAMESKTVVVSKTGTEVALSRTERSLISINNSLSSPHATSTT